ncbi:hypothetical protein Tco_1138554 [Tanacetum coccineum]
MIHFMKLFMKTQLLKDRHLMCASYTPFELLDKWTKSHPIANVIGDPSRSVSTRKQLQTDAMWCYFDAFLTSVEPKTYKGAMLEPFWIDAMQKEIHKFERLQISQSPKGIFINQSNYALEIIKKYGMLFSDLVDTSMVDKSKLDKDLLGKPVDPIHYRGMIGSLMYLTSSRPDLVFAVCMCARYQAKPTEKHLHAHMQMQTTPNVKILDKTHLEVHNSWEKNLLVGHPKSKRALVSPVQRRNILLYSAIGLCCNNVQHSRSKHIDMRYHFIKEQVENGVVELYFVRPEYQLADIFTKAMPRERLNFLVEKLGMKSMSPETLKSLAEEEDE